MGSQVDRHLSWKVIFLKEPNFVDGDSKMRRFQKKYFHKNPTSGLTGNGRKLCNFKCNMAVIFEDLNSA